MTCPVYVKDGTTLTIAAGTIVYANTVSSGYTPGTACDASACTSSAHCILTVATTDTAASCQPFTASLIIEQGGVLTAVGTAASPITFTAKANTANMVAAGTSTTVTDTASGVTVTHGTRGNWGGLILLGRAPVKGGVRNIEGLADAKPYGGNDPTDSSGTLQYVRVWHGGAAIAPDNEINGITFGGVGSGTTVDHCEVAMSIDDGFEFFGGTVNAKYLSTLFVGDDAFDTDKGYQGKMQYLYAMIGGQGHYGAEMDGNKLSAPQVTSAPQVMGMTVVGSASSTDDTMIRLREQGAGQFGNILIGNAGTTSGIRHDCETGATDYVTQAAPIMLPETLYVSPTVVMSEMLGALSYNVKTTDVDANNNCDGNLATATNPTSAVLTTLPTSPNEANIGSIDLTPIGDAVDASNVEAVFDTYFDTVAFVGAFDPVAESWLDGWSYLDCVQVRIFAPGTPASTHTQPSALAG